MIFLLLISQLWAQDVYVQGVDTPPIEYQRFLKQEKKAQSFVSFISQVPPNEIDKLNQLLKKAQYQFLNGSKEEAVASFENIIHLKHKQDWKASERKIIFYSHLRLAQMMEDEKARQEHMRQAFLFDFNQPIDETLFPPLFVNEFAKLKSQSKKELWALPAQTQSFDAILMNGQKIPIASSFMEAPSGEVRVSFLSNRYLPVTITGQVRNLEKIELPLQAISSGHCQSPQYHYPTPPSVKLLLFHPECTASDLAKLEPELLSQAPSAPSKDSRVKTLLGSKWFWIGASVIATGLVMHSLNNQRNQSATPSLSGGAPTPPSSPTPSFQPQVLTN